jgi:hypothetical protein
MPPTSQQPPLTLCCGRSSSSYCQPQSTALKGAIHTAGAEDVISTFDHASVQTTERYLGTKQDLVRTRNGGIKLGIVV